MSPPREAVLARRDSGLGLSVVTQDTRVGSCLRVSGVRKAGPADKAGVAAGDRIISVNGVNISNESHEFALAAFSLSMDGEVVLVVEPDATKIETLDALKPPIRLAERKSSHDLLAKQCEKVSPKKIAPRYELIMKHEQEETEEVVAGNKFVTIQSNPSTGFLGMSVMQFKDRVIRVGGIHPKGPCATADIRPGDQIVSIDGESVHHKTLATVALMLTANRGKMIKLGLNVDQQYDFAEMLNLKTERQIWFQQGEAESHGITLGSTTAGTRIVEFSPEGSLAQYSGLQIGDIVMGVNDNDVSSSSYREILAAVVLSSSPVLTVKHDTTPIVLVGNEAVVPVDERSLIPGVSKPVASRRLPSVRPGRQNSH
eukprot:m.180057 g.180057  ORF g.180057 m.180057 type:complete len:370 (-) comp14916_c0_seq1:136-1245(-)